MPDLWRLIPLNEGTGIEQMTIDSWLLDQHVKGLQPPSLRFYTWRSPTLSLGYHQRQFPDSWKSLHWQNQPINIVRRPTGGRAVLHQGDLTYALVTSGLTGSRREVYQQLCEFLIEGWRHLGVILTFGSVGRGYIHNPNCFGSATAADLVMPDGYKLIGSAQVYRSGCVLQHGSMRLNPDSELFEEVFSEKITPPSLPERLGIDDITQALIEAASNAFNIRFRVQPLTPTERQSALTALRPVPEQPSALS